MINATGYKYWTAFEIRCLDTDRRLCQNQTIYVARKITSDTDIQEIEQMFLNQFLNDHNDSTLQFKVTMTCWPHLIGEINKEEFERHSQTEQPTTPLVNKPSLVLAVDNTKPVVH